MSTRLHISSNHDSDHDTKRDSGRTGSSGRCRRLGGFVLALSASVLLLTALGSSAGATPLSVSAHAQSLKASHAQSSTQLLAKKKKKKAKLPSLASLEKVPSSSVSLTETGSTLLYPLFNLWAPYYEHEWPNISITTAGTGSGTGIAQATAGTVNIGASDAYLSPADVTATPSLENIPLAISAQMVNYNIPGFTGTLKLSGKVLSAIYQGTITMWNASQIAALNPGVTLPALKIVPVHRSDGSGDTFIFTTYLSDADQAGWGTKIGYNTTVAFPAVPGALGENGNGGMVTGCKATPGCVAYIGVSYRNETNAGGLGQAELENGAGHFEALTSATVEAEAAAFAKSTPASGAISLIDSTKAPNGYPIVNYEYAIVNANQANATTAQAVKALLAWAMDSSAAGGSSPAFLNQVNFEPLPTSAIDVAIKLIQKIK